jgi:hypothetical protein
MKKLGTTLLFLFIFLSIGKKGFCQQGVYSLWQKKMNTSVYLNEFLKLNAIAESRVRNNYYGKDLEVLNKIQKDCFKTEKQLIECLKNQNFKKADEYAKSIFSRVSFFGKFVKENPDFYKIDKDLRLKLLTKYFKDNFFPNLII